MLAPMITQMQDSMYGNAHTQGDAVDPFTALAGSAAAASAPAAAAAPAPAPAPATVAAVPASHELETAARPLVSTDTSVLKVVIDRLLKRGALVPEEESVARAAVARLAAGTVSSDGKTEEGGSDADTKAFTSVLRRIIVATNNVRRARRCLCVLATPASSTRALWNRPPALHFACSGLQCWMAVFFATSSRSRTRCELSFLTWPRKCTQL